MFELIPVLDKAAIKFKINSIAERISSDYQDADLVLVGVLKGAFIFMADLIRQLSLEKITVDFVQLASYGSGSETSGVITVMKDISTDIRDKDVLIVEDILDSGITLSFLVKHLERLKPRSVKTCTLIDKHERRQVDIQADYACHRVESGFLVGYGLDFAEHYRNLPEIFHLKT
jgi:hypoxanthine phosphoribosyltransferase